jgi:hypothetical protein
MHLLAHLLLTGVGQCWLACHLQRFDTLAGRQLAENYYYFMCLTMHLSLMLVLPPSKITIITWGGQTHTRLQCVCMTLSA